MRQLLSKITPQTPEAKKAFWLAILRIIPITVAIYTATHTVHLIQTRYAGWMFWMALGGALSIEVLMLSSFELLLKNLVHSTQRNITILALLATTGFSTLVVLGELNALHILPTFQETMLRQILPIAPIMAQWLVIALFLSDHDARQKTLDVKEQMFDSIVAFQTKRKIMQDLQRAVKNVQPDTEAQAQLAQKTVGKIERDIYTQFGEKFRNFKNPSGARNPAREELETVLLPHQGDGA